MTFVEIAAIALYKRDHAEGAVHHVAPPPQHNLPTGDTLEWYKGRARAMLQALRDPTPRMAEGGAMIVRNVHEGESAAAFESDAANVWRYMVDAALEKG